MVEKGERGRKERKGWGLNPVVEVWVWKHGENQLQSIISTFTLINKLVSSIIAESLSIRRPIF